MAAKGGNSGCLTAIGVVFLIGLLASIPGEVWIGILVAASAGVLIWGLSRLNRQRQAKRLADEQAAEAKRKWEAHQQRQAFVNELGIENVRRLDAAVAAVHRVSGSEAAREGWLGDTDFSADITGITDRYRRARALRATAIRLSGLDAPNQDDRRILAEAQAAAEALEEAANRNVALIEQCAVEAASIDESLRKEREDARTAEERATLHGQLNAMLYGIEAAPQTDHVDSAADRVIARVRGYQEIKRQIQPLP
ncbi:hypothetical protein [Gordonia hirsuta]|nr:hypothetical protein [Gordonia hirsuta]